MKRDPIKIVLVMAILVFGAMAVFVGQNKMKSQTPRVQNPVETVEVKPNISFDPAKIDESDSNAEVFLDEKTMDSAKEKIFYSVTIPRAELKPYLDDLTQILNSATAIPYKNSKEEIVGFQLSNIQQNSLFTRIGFKDRDIIVQVNDSLLTSPSSAMLMYSTLASFKEVKFKVVRGRELGHLVVTIPN